MKILVGCEESQAVTVELRKLGHEAFSNDLIECSGNYPEWHLQMDLFEALFLKEWDMFIYFPPCTYLCSSGLHWNKRLPERQLKTDEALNFVIGAWETAEILGIKKIALENPIGCLSTKFRKPNQIIQPYDFGEDASKRTCLWLKGLPKLEPTQYVEGRLVCCGYILEKEETCSICTGQKKAKRRWSNQTNSGQNKLAPSPERGKLRSKTYPGIAKAMATQWV